ncbi:SHOCT domain-containing protein [Psychromonas sp. RZ22]|uniref:SHOCT domain-containing protein n=1 Tax=Psychromonas algarum TaxID=2555643 RepID=UPI0010671BA7|nr:SHOCT domain-containing protein [Psychromonas sp. RZ22]TEW53256.1 SHOCT domain-containing protein [Psychromonas sp. RZ22]
MKLIILLLCFVLTACANPGVVEISPDTYVLFRDDHGGIFGNAGALRADVIRDANTFAKSKGKIAVPVSSTYTPIGNGPGQWASFEYQFRVVNKEDEEAVRTSLKKRADHVVDQNVKIDINSKSSQATKDTYSELIKINDLLEKGIISQAEFEAMKVKILGASN